MTSDKVQVKTQKLLEYISSYSAKNGYPPSVREMCKGLNVKSTATIYYYLNILENQGHINKAPLKNRAIEVVKPDGMRGEGIEIPLLGKIAAGQPISAVENVEDVFRFPDKMFKSGELYMLKVSGDSMIEAGIYNGDFIIVRHQNTAENGDIAVAFLDGNVTVKRFYKEKKKFRLHPENSSMSDIIVDEVEIKGIVVGLIRSM